MRVKMSFRVTVKRFALLQLTKQGSKCGITLLKPPFKGLTSFQLFDLFCKTIVVRHYRSLVRQFPWYSRSKSCQEWDRLDLVWPIDFFLVLRLPLISEWGCTCQSREIHCNYLDWIYSVHSRGFVYLQGWLIGITLVDINDVWRQ